MPDTKTEIASTTHVELPDGFNAVVYYFEPSLEMFDLVAFRDYFRAHFPKGKSYAATTATVNVAPRDPKNGQFHIVFRWTVRNETIDLRVDYARGPSAHESDETEPYAEDFMAWLSTYVKADTVNAHIHCYFAYDIKSRESVITLPLKVVSVPGEPEIDGVSLKFESKPNGVSEVRLTRAAKWHVEAVGERQLTLKGDAPFGDAYAMARTVESILRKAKS